MTKKNLKLYVARRERDLYQKEIAKKLGMHPQTYHEKECGKKDFTLTEARMLAQIFECTLNDLFQYNEKEGNDNDKTRTV